MVERDEIERQLRRIDALPRFLGKPEIRELSQILFADEVIRHLTIGRYEGGWATLCATDRRVLLVDKKPFYLTLEDIRYDMISDVQYDHRLLDASIRLGTVHKTISFLSYSHTKLRALTQYVQEQVMHVRTNPGMAAEPIAQNLVPVSQQQAFVPIRLQPAGLSAGAVTAVLSHLREAPHRRLPVNPYRAPIVVRRRVSRFS
jgi:hypothetical protein